MVGGLAGQCSLGSSIDGTSVGIQSIVIQTDPIGTIPQDGPQRIRALLQ